jgi:hypothetical protein
MPRAEILSKQAMHTLGQLHAELAGKLIDNKREAKRITVSMMQVEAVMKLLEPGYVVRGIAVRRRKANPWFRRGTLFRSAVDALRRAGTPMTAREITDAMIAAKGVAATPKQVRDLQGGVTASLRFHKRGMVAGEGVPVRWRLTLDPSAAGQP